jgi:hypothetical protein
MGLGPLDTKQGDMICVFYGCSIPFVLRKQKQGYILIAEPYIHGYMDGEVVEEVETGSLVSQDFAIH